MPTRKLHHSPTPLAPDRDPHQPPDQLARQRSTLHKQEFGQTNTPDLILERFVGSSRFNKR